MSWLRRFFCWLVGLFKGGSNMATSYSARYGKPVGVNRHGFGGAGLNLDISALAGETELITTFDDFNGNVAAASFGAPASWATQGWEFNDVIGPNGDSVQMNRGTATDHFTSCIWVNPGDLDNTGGNMQLHTAAVPIPTESGGGEFPHIWIPGNLATVNPSPGVAGVALDNTTWMFACRIGLMSGSIGTGNWDGKGFVGWAIQGDGSILDAVPGTITIPSDGPLVGFHIGPDGSIRGISHRTAATAMAEGTNFTEIIPPGGTDGTIANGATTIGDIMWFDLALRMDVSDMSDNAANGETRFYHRRVVQTVNPGQRAENQGGDLGAWREHGTVLLNQTPNDATWMVPTIEAINGAAVGIDPDFWFDWWAMGRSRMSRSNMNPF